MSEVKPTGSSPSTPHSSAMLASRRSAHRAVERRAAAARTRANRRRARAGTLVVLGAMTLAAGAATAQDQVGGASPEAQASASPTLRPGARGPMVVALQNGLRVKADGSYGPKTRRAVRRLQRKRGMKVDGVARPSVLRALGVDARAAARKPSVPPVLERIARCESGGDPRAISASGRYRGKYQFSVSTWRAMGGQGDPARASEARQDRLAGKLFAAQGRAPWPHCGARA